jgi:8-amino-7-oxononanoate synthase
MSDSLQRRVLGRLDEWRRAGLDRTLQPPAGIDLSSNDYLALAADPRVSERFASAARDGCGSTGSRLLRGEREAFRAIEDRFARFKGTGRSLYFSSGYLANIGALTTLTEAGDTIFSDERNHASLIDGARLSRAARVVVPHMDVPRLREVLGHVPCRGHRFVVIESVFSMDGDIAPLGEYAALCADFDATLIVDEAHAVGVYGERGSGMIEEAGLAHDRIVSINTAGKALGVAGAFVAGPAWAIEYLGQRARPFVFSTAAPPAVAAALDASLDVVDAEPERRRRVLELAARLRSRLASDGLIETARGSQIVPIVLGDNRAAVAVAGRLQRDGFDVRAIRWPTVAQGSARLRVSVNAGLSNATLDRFGEAVTRAVKELGLCSAASS